MNSIAKHFLHTETINTINIYDLVTIYFKLMDVN